MVRHERSRVEGFIILTYVFRKEGHVWTAECRELGTATYGRTLKQAHDELTEMVGLHLNTLEKHGDRERFFKEHNIKFYTDGSPAELTVRLPVADEPGQYIHPHRQPVSVA